MKMFEYKRFFWALRKIKLPVDSCDLVLDVGSGDNPHPRADVLVDRLNGSEHRGGGDMVVDRLAIIGDATKLPFKDKCFDFVVASHVLEHIPDPEKFILEMQRVGKAGYIETPNFMCERLLPSKAHCLEVGVVDDTLHIYKKERYDHDDYISKLNFLKADKGWSRAYFEDPSLFHSRVYWKDEIKYFIHNPETSCDWINDVYANSSGSKGVLLSQKKYISWRSLGLFIYEFIQKIGRKKRLKIFNVSEKLVCPNCRGKLFFGVDTLECKECEMLFSMTPYYNFETPVDDRE